MENGSVGNFKNQDRVESIKEIRMEGKAKRPGCVSLTMNGNQVKSKGGRGLEE